jgi:hypothetical protein
VARVGWQAWAIGLVVMAASCGGTSSGVPTSPSTGGSGLPQGTLSLTHALVDSAAIRWITPLGNLNPPGHTLPTDHIYFYIADPDAGESPVARRTPMYAPGSGVVNFVIGGGVGQESKVMVRQTATMSYYVDHVILSAPIVVGSVITAGQVLGTSGSAYAVDLGVINTDITVGFVNPSRYVNTGDALHADRPLKYFTEPLRSQLYARVQRLGPDLDGQTSYDKAGTLAGNWFTATGGFSFSFAFDTYDPARPLISAGVGTFPGVFGLAASDPLPAAVTVASGRVVYTLHRTSSGPRRSVGAPYWMLVEMSDATHIRVEIFNTAPTDFTARALSLVR